MRVFLIALALMFVAPAWGNPLTVSWTAPTQNTDGSPLTNLASFYIQWGPCTADMDVRVTMGGTSAGKTKTSVAINPTNLDPVCVQVFAVSSANRMSAPAYGSYSAPAPAG